jgi:cell division septation protein DedD
MAHAVRRERDPADPPPTPVVSAGHHDAFLPGSGCGQHQLFVVASSQFSALTTGDQITGFAFRPDANLCAGNPCGAFAATTVHSITIQLATTTTSASDTSDGTFADFLTNAQTVFSGDATVSSNNTGPVSGPKDFDILFPFTTPYAYNPASGNLVVSLVIPNGDGIPSNIDADQGGSVESRIFGCATGQFSPSGIHDNTGPAVIQFDINGSLVTTPTPTTTPTSTPTKAPTSTPTTKPTNTPTNTPTNASTVVPTDTPTPRPTKTPTNTPTAAPTATPGHEICRGPGFWATHARFDPPQPRSRNITSAAILAAGGCLNVCGEVLVPTGISSASAGCSGSSTSFKCPKIVNDADSAEEALCVAPRGNKRLELVRHLTAAALNCAVSNGSSDCTGTSGEEAFKACNAACAVGLTDASLDGNTVDCVKAVECINNGGQFDSLAQSCQFGTCSTKKAQPCGTGFPGCPSGSTCVRTVGNCSQATFGTCSNTPTDDNPAVLCGSLIDPGTGFGTCQNGSKCKPGPAGSSNECNAAISNACTVIPPGEASCKSGNTCGASENCCDSTACPVCLSGDVCTSTCP